MNNVEREFTNRGFLKIEFDDLYRDRCSLQESSLATDHAVWLGANEIKEHLGEKWNSRMHLNKKMAWWLVKELLFFILFGRLRE